LQFKARLGKQSAGPYLEKKTITNKRAGGGAQGVDPEFKPQDYKKEKSKNKNKSTITKLFALRRKRLLVASDVY
jgi:hypothetical protein